MSSRGPNIVYTIRENNPERITRYIGKSTSGLSRAYEHFAYGLEKNEELALWMEHQLVVGNIPIVEILAECDPEDLKQLEEEFIKEFASETLFNIRHNSFKKQKRETFGQNVILDMSPVTGWPWSTRRDGHISDDSDMFPGDL